jgi:hypothetical protein
VSVKKLEREVVAAARTFSRVWATTVGFGKPVARAAKVLNDRVEQLEAAYERGRASSTSTDGTNENATPLGGASKV